MEDIMTDFLRGTNSKIILIGKIKGLAEECKRARIRLLKSKSQTKSEKYAYTKYIVGGDVRHHLLAYAFLRGTPYNVLEKKYRPGHAPNAETILNIVLAHFPTYYKRYAATQPTLEHINNWLKGDLDPGFYQKFKNFLNSLKKVAHS